MQAILKIPGPLVMGILNATPDSFSDGGHFNQLNAAICHAEQMIAEGVDVIDVGGESTRPGAQAVSIQQELDRVIPIVESIVDLGKPISVDTSKPQVMCEAINAGALMINDVRALTEEGALEVIADSQVEVCLMHMQGEPRSMQHDPIYEDVIAEVAEFLTQRVGACEKAGIAKSRVCLDPGIGFGKTLEHNCQLLKGLQRLSIFELPLLVGVSRKSMLGQILNIEVSERMIASVAAGLISVTNGAKILRVHDVKATRQAIDIYKAIESK